MVDTKRTSESEQNKVLPLCGVLVRKHRYETMTSDEISTEIADRLIGLVKKMLMD